MNNKVEGFINESDAPAIEETFGKKLADEVKNAPEGSTFLSILFKDFS